MRLSKRSNILMSMMLGLILAGGCGDDDQPRPRKPAQPQLPASGAGQDLAPQGSSGGSFERTKHPGINKLEATRIGVGSVHQVDRLDPAEFPDPAVFVHSGLKKKMPSPDGKWLVWRDKVDGSWELVLSKRDGSGEMVLPDCRNGYQPQWSPNSKNIAFTAINWETGKRNLYRYNLKSMRKVRMFGSKHAVGALAAWSEDGTKIAFTYYHDLWIMNTSSIGKKMLDVGFKVGEADVLGFSKDGASIAYRARRGGPYYIIDLKPEL